MRYYIGERLCVAKSFTRQVSKLGKYSKMSKEDRKNIFRALGYVSQMGITMAACVVFGVLFGLFLDNRLGTGPWLLLVFTLLGCVAGFKAMIDIAKKM